MSNLGINLCGIDFVNPVLTASGTFGYGQEFADFVDYRRLGGIVVKSVSLEPRVGNVPPRLFETSCGLLNSIGLQNVGLDEFLREKLPALRQYPTKVIVNIAGRTIDEYVEVAERLSATAGIDALELNLSCPNVKEGDIVFGQSSAAVEKVVGAVRKKTQLPVWVKLSPNVADIAPLAQAAEASGADAICAINTLQGIAIDVKTRRPFLGNTIGGLSGPAIKPVALFHVWEIYQVVSIPVIGIGGICTAQDAIEFVLAGASAVQVGSANFRDPDVTMRIVDGLEHYMEEAEVDHIWDLRGAAWR